MNMLNNLAQPLVTDDEGCIHVQDDWHPDPLPRNAIFDEMSYPDTSYSFTTFFSRKDGAFKLGFASGNYGHGIFNTGENGIIHVGKFVVLQCTRIISNLSVTIKDHCMFSWGSVITDSWVNGATDNYLARRTMLRQLAHSPNRHLEFIAPQPVVIEENVWVGFEAIILPGVTIGRGAVVGCRSVVSDNVPPYAVVVGNPAKVIKYLMPNDTDEVKQQALHAFNITL